MSVATAIPPAERAKLVSLVDDLSTAIEDLLLGGLTTASQATRDRLDVAFREASRLKLLRLGSALRVASEELGRHLRHEETFSGPRYVYFVTHAWLLAQGIGSALRASDAAKLARILRTSEARPVARLEVVTLGVAKKVVPRAFAAFDLRLRLVSAAGDLPAGQALTWSCIFPMKPGKDGEEVPAEAYLHLPQPQRWKPSDLLDGRVATIEGAHVALDEEGLLGRVQLQKDSKVTVLAKAKPDLWARFHAWTPDAALARLRAHEPSPIDVETELSEEVVLHDWTIGDPVEHPREQRLVFPVQAGPLRLDAVASLGVEGAQLTAALRGLKGKKKQHPPLFGLMHYARCKLVLQPLSLLHDKGPELLTLDPTKIDASALLRALY